MIPAPMIASTYHVPKDYDLYALIGYPLGHSFSATYFSQFFAEHGIRARYQAFELREASLMRELIQAHPRLRGINVTSPHKQAVLPLLDELTPLGQRVGAVNAIRVERRVGGEARLVGHNTDVEGFVDSLKSRLSTLAPEDEALILGTGGAARAVALGLEMLGIRYRYVSREPQTEEVLAYTDLKGEDLADRYHLIINATPVGMPPRQEELPPLSLEGIGEQHLCYDLIYNPSPTRWLSAVSERGARAMDGLEMLYLQAKAAWLFWKGKSRGTKAE